MFFDGLIHHLWKVERARWERERSGNLKTKTAQQLYMRTRESGERMKICRNWCWGLGWWLEDRGDLKTELGDQIYADLYGREIEQIKRRLWLGGMEYQCIPELCLSWLGCCSCCSGLLTTVLLTRICSPTHPNTHIALIHRRTGMRGQSVCELSLLTQWPSPEDVGYPF